MDPREPIAVPVLAKDPKKPEDGKPEKEPPRGGFMQKKPKKKTDLMDMDIKRKKEEADFSPLVETAIPEAVSLAKAGNTVGAVERLYAVEKQCRNGGDAFSTAKVVCAIAEILWAAGDLKVFLENLQIISKKRGQLKQAITAVVQKAMTFLDELHGPQKLPTRMELIASLRTITEGKIYVENERARLTMTLAKIQEDQGKLKEASETLQEVQVETYGAMEKKEKTEFILEQMRLCLATQDYVRAQIISRKINPKVLLEKGFEDLKLKYYKQMIEFYAHYSQYVEIAKCYQHIYDTPTVKADPAQWQKYLQLIVTYLVLSPFDNEQSDFINRVNLDRNLDDIPTHRQIMKTFLTKELMMWPLVEKLYKADLFAPARFSSPAEAEKVWTDFRKRVIEHNIRVVAGYYTRISVARLAQFLFLNKDETEKNVAELVVSKSIFAKIDRPRGIINFQKRKEPAEVLNEWGHSIGELLELVESTTHLIHRENMVHLGPKAA
jgi:26S proteasome regulatory subunit N5